jgi:hypothetical protein
MLVTRNMVDPERADVRNASAPGIVLKTVQQDLPATYPAGLLYSKVLRTNADMEPWAGWAVHAGGWDANFWLRGYLRS